MSFISLKNKIKTVLQGINAIQEVHDYPTEDFSGYPAVVVRTDGNTSNYETTNENEELYTFTIYALQNLDGVFSKTKARQIIEELCDTIRDKFDSDEFLSGLSLPSGRTMLGIRPTVSKIFEEENGKFCVAEIELAVRVSKTV